MDIVKRDRLITTVQQKLSSGSPINFDFGHIHQGLRESLEKIRPLLNAEPDPTGVVIKSFPVEGASFKNGLYGPASGDAPVGEDADISYKARPVPEGQSPRGNSRLVKKPMRDTDLLTVVYGPHMDEKTGQAYLKVLYTVFGGPPAEREPTDPYFNEHPEDVEGYEKAVQFWKEHALSHESF